MSREFFKAKDLGMWIESNVEDKDSYDEVCKAIYWFIACQEAKDMCSLSLRTMAEVLLKGLPAIDDEYVDEYLDILYDGYEEDEMAEVNETIETNLKEHFGINKR